MTMTEFRSVAAPENIENPDETPTLEGVENPCEICGKETRKPGARGRAPRFCDEHKQSKSTGNRVKGTNAQLAAQATEALMQVNAMVSVGAMVVGYYETASAISDEARAETFRAQVYSALLTDPALCRSILRAGTTSGKLSLIIAYAMFGMSIFPVTVNEYRDKRDERLSQLEAAS